MLVLVARLPALLRIFVTYPNFLARWQASGGAEHANYGLFLQDLCDLLGVPRPEPTTDDPAQQQSTLALPQEAAAAASTATETGPQPWPTALAQQAASPLGAAQVSARFRGSSAKKVQPLLDTLALMSLVRFVEEENKCAA